MKFIQAKLRTTVAVPVFTKLTFVRKNKKKSILGFMKIYGTVESLIPEHRSAFLNKYYSDDQIRRMLSPVHVARMGDRRGAYIVLVGKPQRKSLLGKLWLEYDIKIDLQELGLEYELD